MKDCLSVLIPCFNEETTIAQVLDKVLLQDCVREIIVIDDGSTDGSRKIVEEFSNPKITLLCNPSNLGKGSSVQHGIKEASSQFLVIQDADLEYSPEEYSRLLKPLIDGRADAVFGSRFLSSESRRALYFWHSMGNKFLTFLSNMFSNLYLTDMETGYKMMCTPYAKNLKLREPRFGLEPEITAKLAKMNARIYEVPISYYGRTYDEGKKITWKDGLSALRCILKYNLLK
jgi:glycosyltransferase involved in cell wall biosynthesis